MCGSLRILRTIHSLNPAAGGVSTYVSQSSKVIGSLGHAVEIASLDSPDSDFLRSASATVNALGPGLCGYGYNSKFTKWINSRVSDFDAVVVEGLWQFHGLSTRKAALERGIPYFVFPHGMLDPWFKAAYPFKHLKKWFYWPWAEYRVLRDAEGVIFTCEEERLLARKSFWLYRCNEEIVNLGVEKPPIESDVLKSAFYERYPQLRGKRILLFLGRIHEKKGVDMLIRAFLRVLGEKLENGIGNPNGMVLLIAGPCEDRAFLKRLKRLSADLFASSSILWPGMLTGDLKWGAFYAADVFMLPSHQENFGIAVVEALATGTPVLISNRVNIWREIVQDGAGYAEEDSVVGTLQLIERWLGTQPDQWDAMKRRAQRCFQSRFEIGKVAESLVEVIQKGIERSG